MTKVNFVTTNSYKFEVAKSFFDKKDDSELELVQFDLETPEIQDISEEHIASESAKWVSAKIGEIAISSDVGFRIDALNGFPGPFVKYVNKWLTPKDVLQLMQGKKDRSAHFIDVLAYATPWGDVKTFVTRTPGSILVEDLGETDESTMDSVFIPEGHTATLALMDDDEKDTVWSDQGWIDIVQHLKNERK